MTAPEAPQLLRPTPTGAEADGGRTAARRLQVWLPPGDRYGPGWLRDWCGPWARLRVAEVAGRRVWLVPRAHFAELAQALADRYGVAEVTVDTTATSVCGRLCRDAEGDECSCQCLGENHGGQPWRQEWVRVGDGHWLVEHKVRRQRYRVASARPVEPIVVAPEEPADRTARLIARMADRLSRSRW